MICCLSELHAVFLNVTVSMLNIFRVIGTQCFRFVTAVPAVPKSITFVVVQNAVPGFAAPFIFSTFILGTVFLVGRVLAVLDSVAPLGLRHALQTVVTLPRSRVALQLPFTLLLVVFVVAVLHPVTPPLVRQTRLLAVVCTIELRLRVTP